MDGTEWVEKWMRGDGEGKWDGDGGGVMKIDTDSIGYLMMEGRFPRRKRECCGVII